jgi:hypothetical protein
MNGAPINGIGIQAHFSNQLTPPDRIVQELNRWAAMGLDIQITEFDIDVSDEQVQAQYTRDFMTAVFSQPAVNALLSWGFWEGSDWIPQAAYYRKDWTIKPNGQVWADLVLKQWRTDTTAATDDTGAATTRGFLGHYLITVTLGGKSQTAETTLTNQGTSIEVDLPP